MGNAEYDAFGPWIIEIDDKNLMPTIFKSYYHEPDNHLMLIKIPRHIDRRDAKPGMDLYDYVIGLFDGYISIFKRENKNVSTRKIQISEIEAITNYRDLLSSQLILYLSNEKFIIEYNSLSSNIIERFMKFIRDRYVTKNNLFKIPKINNNNEENLSFFYNNLFGKINDKEDFSIVAVQNTKKIDLIKRVNFEWIKSKIIKHQLLETMHLANNKELLVITRGRSFNKSKKAIYSYAYNYIPLENIASTLINYNTDYLDVDELEILTKNNKFKFYFDNKNEYKYFYSNVIKGS